ncbi:MAG: hypothetical protein E6Q34_00175 [Burkholderiaceae bacterium]|nr:MAG: hypothetical protein E6Q34_00175 [Burkholderiaceae bacterium]
MAYEAYYKHYEDRGFSFDRGLLTSYCLSLRTKPFVILSGISGTGKTKIAQFFSAPALAAALKTTPVTAPSTAPTTTMPAGKWIIMTVTDGISSGDGRANFKYSDLDALLSPAEIATIQPLIDQLRKSGAEDNICDPFEFTIETPDGQTLKALAYLQRASSPLLRVRFKSKKGEAHYDSTPYFAKNYKSGTVLKLEKIGEKRLSIVSVNDKIVIAKSLELEKEERKHIKNTCFISVRSDWTDATPLFGHYNFIDQRYHLTPALNFILTACEHPEIPFFLILDEMNLAKVEHYFSDFLSCLESRHIEDGKLTQEPIHIHSDSGWLNTNSDYFDLIGPTVALPPNLFVTGTVNIDESTYMFSSKVLDRANVIELNDVDINAYGSGVTQAGASTFVLKDFPNLAQFELSQKSDFQKIPVEAKNFLTAVHAILEKHHLHFGYRVINEVSRYILNAQSYCEDEANLVSMAIDRQLVQKVLPKLNGPQSKLDIPVRELLTLINSGVQGPAMEWDAVDKLETSTCKYPLTAAKLKRMSKALTLNGFANFIE